MRLGSLCCTVAPACSSTSLLAAQASLLEVHLAGVGAPRCTSQSRLRSRCTGYLIIKGVPAAELPSTSHFCSCQRRGGAQHAVLRVTIVAVRSLGTSELAVKTEWVLSSLVREIVVVWTSANWSVDCLGKLSPLQAQNRLVSPDDRVLETQQFNHCHINRPSHKLGLNIHRCRKHQG